MRRLGTASLLAVAIVALFSAPAGARARPGDVAATRAYLNAQYVEVRAAAATYRGGIKSVEALGARVQAECPGVLAAAPHSTSGNASVTEASEEVFAAILRTPERAAHAAYQRFARAVGHLHWSNSTLTRLVHSSALERATQSAIPAPNLCADMQSWAASGYRTVSPATAHYLHLLTGANAGSATGSDPAKTIPRLLASSEDATGRTLVKRIKSFEAKHTRAVGNTFVVASAKVSAALHA